MPKTIILVAILIACVAFSCSYLDGQRGPGLFLAHVYYFLNADAKNPDQNPSLLSRYPENKTGYYRFDPKTILGSLDQDQNVFTPISKDDVDLHKQYNDIAWTQSDFLHVANELSHLVWQEPLNLTSWSVHSIWFDGSCDDNFGGFDRFWLTYYKTVKTGWESIYTARYIQVDPGSGIAIWAGDSEFSANFLLSWKNIELTKFQTTAEQAVRSAEEYRRKSAGLNSNGCSVNIHFYNRHKYDWQVFYSWPTSYYVFINPFTGKARSTK